MLPNQDFKDLFAEFNARGVEFLVVGAHALAAHGHVRATKDLDVWIRPERSNARRVVRALEAFGAPLQSVTESDFAEPGITFQIGVDPVRIDLLTAVDGRSDSVLSPQHPVLALRPTRSTAPPIAPAAGLPIRSAPCRRS